MCYMQDFHFQLILMANVVNFCMVSLDFIEFPDLIEYYTTIGTSTILKEEYNTIEYCTLLKDISNLMYHTQLNFLEDTPNQILHMLSTLILWSKALTLLLANILPYTIYRPSQKMN